MKNEGAEIKKNKVLGCIRSEEGHNYYFSGITVGVSSINISNVFLFSSGL